MSDPSRVLAQAAGTLTTVQAVINLVAGETWGDLPIIYRLEAGLEVGLWRRHQ